MKKTTSVNVKLVALVAILMAIVFSVSALLLVRSTISASAAVSDNCGYNEDDVYVDYSGQGTVINGKLTGDSAKVNGNNVDIPVYKAAYEPNSGWNWFWNWSWSDWSTSNNKTNDYNTYRGETATEYQVESRQEYKYRRNESRDVYSTKYYTTYQGTKWYNCWIFLFTSDWSGYGGAKSGYKIVNRYTKSEKSGTKQVTVYDNEWKASAPFNWAWENKWEAYTSRTTYRYRSLDMKWSDTAQKTTEQVPLNYSLYDNSGKPIQLGAIWTYNKNISNEKDFYTTTTIVDRYILNTDGIIQLLEGKEYALDTLIKNNKTSWWEWAIGTAVGIGTLGANPYVGGAILFVQQLYSAMGIVVANSMQDKYESLKELLVIAKNYNLNFVFEYYQTATITSSGGSNYVNMKQFATNRDYIAMKYQDNENPTKVYFSNDAYGTISYMSSTKNLINSIDTYVKLKNLPMFVY